MSERVKFFTVNALSLLVFIAIAVQAYIYRRQWEAMEDSLAETRKIVDQNERAVKVAERGIEVAQNAAYIEQRAYVGIQRMTVEGLDEGRCPILNITWINGGKTPAWRFRCVPRLVFGQVP